MKERLANSELNILASQKINEKKFWQNQLCDVENNAIFLYEKVNEQDTPKEIKQLDWSFSEDLSNKLLSFSDNNDHKLLIVLLAAVFRILEKYSGNTDLLIGTPIMKQNNDKDLINYAVVLRLIVNQDEKFKEYLNNIKETLIKALNNQNFPIKTLFDTSNESNVLNSNVNVTVLLDRIQQKDYLREFNYDICFQFKRNDKEVKCEIEYPGNLYHESTIKRIIQNVGTFLANTLESPDRVLKNYNFINENELAEIKNYNATTLRNYKEGPGILDMFKSQVSAIPDKVAVICGSTRLTYKELDLRSDILATRLKYLDCNKMLKVAILLGNSVELTIALFAVWKAGGAYVPLSPDSPEKRILNILSDAGADYIISNGELIEKFHFISGEKSGNNSQDLLKVTTGYSCSCIDIDSINKEGISPIEIKEGLNEKKIAYIIYTSGSTGKPNGVIVNHKSLLNYTLWKKESLDITPDDITLQLVPFTFDGFGANFFPTIAAGGSIFINDFEMEKKELCNVILKEGITNYSTVPAIHSSIVLNALPKHFKYVKWVVIAGEKASTDLLGKYDYLNESMVLVNEYGPTECTISATAKIEMSKNDPANIGKPINNTTIFVLDKELKELPIGALGELCVSGDCLAEGYLNNPVLTRERFVRLKQSGDIIYRTGDLVRILPNGDIRFEGRIDNQLNINGNRIEPSEIEANIYRFSKDINNVLIVVHKGGQNNLILYAYIVMKDAIKINDLKEFLLSRLPHYYIPKYFIQLEEIPLTMHGKIDYKSLPVLHSNTSGNQENVAPRNELDKKLVLLWKKELGITDLGINHNYFNIGGDSIKAIGLLNKINSMFNLELSIADLYENETIEKLSDFVKNINSDNTTKDTEIESELERLKDSVMEQMKSQNNNA